MTSPEPPAAARLYAANAAAAEFYAARLRSSESANAYLDKRGIPHFAGDGHWQIGYAPSRWTDLAEHLLRNGFTAADVTAAGLGFVHRTSKHLLDRFRDRITFPLTDHHNRTVAFTARDLSGRAEARWINSPETPIYRKRELLYGLGQQLARRPAVKESPLIFVGEGAADVLALHTMTATQTTLPASGPTYAVAPCGTHLTPEQLGLLHQLLPGAHLVFAFDGDEAGHHALSRTYPIVKAWPGELSGVRLPTGQDPADLLAAHGPTPAIGILTSLTRPLAELRMIGIIEDMYERDRITDPVTYAGDRLAVYRAIADLFVDAPEIYQTLARTAARLLRIDATDVITGVLETLPSHNPGPSPAAFSTQSRLRRRRRPGP